MADRPIQNCQVRFQFKCPNQWDALQETAESGVRLCGECHKQVYLCQSTQEAAEHARAGHCIAAPVGLVSPGAPTLQPQGLELDPELLKLVPKDIATKHGLVPVGRSGSTLTVAMSELKLFAVDDVKFLTGYNVEVMLASKQDIQEALERAYREPSTVVELGIVYCRPEEPSPEPAPLEGPVGKIIRKMLLDAHAKNEAQIQIDITGSSIVVRFGLEGSRRDFMSPPFKLKDELLRQLHRAASTMPGQEGQLHLKTHGTRISYQMSFHPTALGQEVILQPLS
jgi:type IV pilus assembly protein PilB